MIATRNEVPEAMARAAAHWWAGMADGTARHNNRGGDLASVFAGIMADTLNETPRDGALEKFEEILAEKIMTAELPYMWRHIWVDYGPDQILCEAAKEAGISCNNFPWKTGMGIDPEKGTIHVRISMGEWQQIYPEKEEGSRASGRT